MGQVEWQFDAIKKFRWYVEWLELEGTKREYFQQALGLDFEVRNKKTVRFHQYYDRAEYDLLHDIIEERYEAEPSFVRHVYNRCYELSAHLLDFTRGLYDRHDLNELADSDLQRLVDEYICRALLIVPILFLRLDRVFGKRILRLIHRKVKPEREPDITNEMYFAFMSPHRDVAVLRQHRELLEIAARIQGDRELTRKLLDGPIDVDRCSTWIIEELQKQTVMYGWINTDRLGTEAWAVKDLLKRLQNFLHDDCVKQTADLEKRKREKEWQYQRFLELIDPRPVDVQMIQLAREFAYIDSYRAEVSIKADFQMRSVLTEIARRIGIAFDELANFTFPEITDFLIQRQVPSREQIAARRACSGYEMIDRTISYYFGEDCLKLVQSLPKEEVHTSTQVAGLPANPGKVVGVAKVVIDLDDLDKVKRGDVLICPMTMPEFIPAMEKASAFVTNEGGVTCHAAIISRELGIPCVIGTRIATQVFSDGNIVEVDAHAGYVKRLS